MDELVNTGTLLAHIPVLNAGEVLERALGVRLHRLGALAPVGGADLAVLVLSTRNRGRFRESVINGMNANWMHVR